MAKITDLPPEILAGILCFLELRDIYSCKAAQSLFCQIANDYKIVEYEVVKRINQVEDNLFLKLSATEKLQRLEAGRLGWSHFEIDFQASLLFEHKNSGLYDLTGGLYFSGNVTRTALYYCRLPSERGPPMMWDCLQMGEGRIIVDFGVSAEAHDLVVVLTRRHASTNARKWTLELNFLQISTGKPHPYAKQPVMAVYETRWKVFSAYLEIVDNTLILIIHHSSDFSTPPDYLYAFNWKEGKSRMSITAPYCSLYGMVPLSEDKLIIGNAVHQSLDLWRIPSTLEEQRTVPERSLELPRIHPDWFIRSFASRGEPNPGTHLPFSSRLFHSDADNAIVIFNLSLQSGGEITKFSLITHRRSLLDLFPDEPDRRRGTPPPDPDLDDPEFDPPDRPEPVVWDNWGPSCTRIIHLSPWFNTWITISAGQRFVNVVQLPAGVRSLEIYDFNPWRIKQAEAAAREAGLGGVESGQLASCIRQGLGFVDVVESRLPFSVVKTRSFPHFDLLLIDEERLLGFSNDEEGDMKTIQVFHMGRPAQ